MNRKLRSFRDRVVNAFGMLRRGELLSMVKAVIKELKHRVENVRAWWLRRQHIDFSKIPGSAYADSRKVTPASYRPTQDTEPGQVVLSVDRDAIADELASLRDSIELPEPRVS